MAIELATAYVSLVADTSGIGRQINSEFGRAVTRADQAGRSMGNSLAAGLGKGLAVVAAGGALIGGLTSIVNIGNEVTNSLNTMQAVSRATADQMASVSARAKELGNDLSLPGTSAADAATAMTELAKGGFSVEQSMAAAKGTLQLAAAAQIDAATAATIQSQALQAFGKDAGFAATAADILANASNASSAEITDVAYGLQASGAVAHQFGLTMEDTATALALFANSGIQGSDAGTLLKSALLALTDQGNPAQGAIEDLGLTVYDTAGQFVGLESLFGQLQTASKNMTPEMYQAATATLFGSDAARLAGIAAQQGSEGFALMETAIGREGAAAEVAAAKTQGLPGAMSAVQNAAETLALGVYDLVDGPLESFALMVASFIDTAAPALLGALEGIGTAFSVLVAIGAAVSGFIGEHSALFTGLAIVVGTLFLPALLSTAATLAAQAITYTVLTAQILAYRTAAAVATAAQWLWNASLLANPIVLIIAGIAALVAGLVYFFTQTELGRQIWETVWGAITAAVGAAWDFIRPVWDNILAGLEGLGGKFLWLWDNVVSPVMGWIGDRISQAWNGVIKPAWDNFKIALEVLGAVFRAMWEVYIRPAWENLQSGFSAGWGIIKGAIDIGIGYFEALRDAVKYAIEFILAAWEKVSGTVSSVLEVTGKITSVITNPLSAIPGRADGGVFRGAGTGTSDSNLVRISDGEFVVNARSTAANLPLLERINGGFADGGLVGKLGGGVINTSIWEFISSKFPNATLNSGYRSGDPGFHGIKAAVDFGGPMQAIADYAFANKDKFAQIIWANGPVWYNVRKNELGTGVATASGAEARGIYGARTMAGHADHVHIAAEDAVSGGATPPPTLPDAAQLPRTTGDLPSSQMAAPESRTSPSTSTSTPKAAPAEEYQKKLADTISGRFGDAASAFVSGQVSDVLGLVGFPDSPSWMKAQGEFEGATSDYAKMRADQAAWEQEQSSAGTTTTSPSVPGLTPLDPRGPAPSVQDLKVDEPVAYDPGKGAGQWTPVVQQALKMLGASLDNTARTVEQIGIESGGNPNAVNNWDSNAAKGDPSKGLLQVIGSTFRAYRSPNLPDDQMNPLANIYAGANYAIDRYTALEKIWPTRAGYDSGGVLRPGMTLVENKTGRNEVAAVFNPQQWDTMTQLASNNGSGGGLSIGQITGSNAQEIAREVMTMWKRSQARHTGRAFQNA